MYYFLKPNLILKESEIEAIEVSLKYDEKSKNELWVIYQIYTKSREKFGSEILCAYPEFSEIILKLDAEKCIFSNLIDKLAIEAIEIKNNIKNMIDFVNCLEFATDKAINEMQNEDSGI